MGKLWSLVEEWRTGQHQFAPSPRQIALRIGTSPSTFTGWKEGLTELPKRRNLYELHALTNIPFSTLVDAAIEDARLHDPEVARAAAEEYRRRKEEREGGATVHRLRPDEPDASGGVDAAGPEPGTTGALVADEPGEPTDGQRIREEQDAASEEGQDPEREQDE